MRMTGLHHLLGLAALATLLVGCPNPNTYGTPRTTPKGEVLHTIAAELNRESAVFTARPPGLPSHPQTETQTYPMLPTYQFRGGLADRVDVGVRLTNLSGIGADVKWNFLRTKVVDLAIDPGVHAHVFLYGHTLKPKPGLYMHLPLLLGLNFGERVTLVLFGGPAVGVSSGSIQDNERVLSGAPQGAAVHGGVGVQLRTSKKFAIHPEISATRFDSRVENLIVVFGVGFLFGGLPSYASEGEGDGPAQTTDR
jgi:hypothetical protein